MAETKPKAAEKAETTEERKLQPFSPANLEIQSAAYNTFNFPVPYGISLEDALKPEMWAHMAGRFRLHDEARLIADDGSWWAHVIVRDKTATSVAWDVIHSKEFEKARDKDIIEGVEIRYTASERYTLIDGNKTVGKNIATRNQAVIERAKYIDKKAA